MEELDKCIVLKLTIVLKFDFDDSFVQEPEMVFISAQRIVTIATNVIIEGEKCILKAKV